MAKKTPSHYRDEDAKQHQEVVTPPELVDLIHSHLQAEDLKGNILDPCVGPGALIQPLLDNPEFKSLTVCDIQEVHIKNLEDRGFVKIEDTSPLEEEW